MDPNTALSEAREIADGIVGAVDGVPTDVLDEADVDALMLAERFRALDEWLTKGGFLPSEWAKSTARRGEGGS